VNGDGSEGDEDVLGAGNYVVGNYAEVYENLRPRHDEDVARD